VTDAVFGTGYVKDSRRLEDCLGDDDCVPKSRVSELGGSQELEGTLMKEGQRRHVMSGALAL
jgi:hypothetical protein